MSYNGWSNYETWNVANDQGTYGMVREWTEDAIEQAGDTPIGDRIPLTVEETAQRDVAQRLQDFVEENNPLSGDGSMYSDILSANLREVNYDEIAAHWVEEMAEVEA